MFVWIFKKKAKIGGGLAGICSVVGAILLIQSDISNEIAQAEERSKEFTKVTYQTTHNEIETLRGGQEKILKAIEKLDDRIYDLNKNKSN